MDWQLGELNVRAFALVVLLALLPVAADAQGTRSLTDEALKQHAQNKVKYDLLDPDATQFREIELFSRTNPETGEVSRIVCGQFNGKNAYGAYTGFKRFFYGEATDLIVREQGDGGPLDQVFPALWKGCSES